MLSQGIITILKYKTLIWTTMALVLGLGLLAYFRAFFTRRLVKKALRHNGLWEDGETSVFSLTGESIRVKNYKLKTDQDFEKLIEVLEQETKQRYFYARKRSVLKIKKFPPLPRQVGLYLQSVEDGKIEKYKPQKNSNGVLIAAKPGAGKSVLIKKLLEENAYSELLIISPKGDEDFKTGMMPTSDAEEVLLEMLKKASDGYYKDKAQAIIVLDEIITLGKIFKKDTVEKINIALTIIRSQNLRVWIATQKLNKSSASIDISLLVEKILNVPDIKNFYESLGIVKIRTPTESLRPGEFSYIKQGVEKILVNIIDDGGSDGK